MGEQSWTSACFHRQRRETSDSEEPLVQAEHEWGGSVGFSNISRGFTTRNHGKCSYCSYSDNLICSMVSNTVWFIGFWWTQPIDRRHWMQLWYVSPSKVCRAAHQNTQHLQWNYTSDFFFFLKKQFQSTSQEKDNYCCTAQLLWGVATSTPCYSLNRDTQKRSCYNDEASRCKTKQNWLRKVVFSVPKAVGSGDGLVPCRLVQHSGPNYIISNTGWVTLGTP